MSEKNDSPTAVEATPDYIGQAVRGCQAANIHRPEKLPELMKAIRMELVVQGVATHSGACTCTSCELQRAYRVCTKEDV